MRDDGAVIYLNGTEVVRSNMPAGTVTAATLAPVAIGGTDESAWTETPITTSLLQAGANVIAVGIHQQSATSSDVSFDLELRATDVVGAPPAVTLISPSHQLVSNSTSVTFQASATSPVGLASMALYIGGPPLTAVFVGPSQVQDAQLVADTPTLPNGGSASINTDGLTPHAHALTKFPTLIGGGAGQVPAGAIISSATLALNCTNPGQAMQIFRLTQDWDEDQATWSERALGVPWGAPGADGAASNAGIAGVGDCTVTGLRGADVTRFVQEWADGAPNYGMVFTDSGTDGVLRQQRVGHLAQADGGVQDRSDAARHPEHLRGERVRHLLHHACGRDLFLERPGDRHERPVQLCGCRRSADSRSWRPESSDAGIPK